MSKLTSLQILIDELDNELISSSTTIESFQAFHSLAWFRKPGCTYVTDAAGLTLYNESDAIPYIVNALAQKMSVFQSPEPVLPNFVKSLLALSDLIQLLPIKQPYEELNPKILTIAQIPTESFQPHYQKLEQSLANLIELFVKLGLNPLKLLLDPSSPKSDPMFILHQVILCTASKESFDTAMKVIQTIIPSITSDKRIPFFETFYDFLYKFYTRFPSIHSDLINNGLESVQPVVDNLWKIKKDLEPQLVSILCSLIPMCHTQLTAAANSKKSPFKSVLKTVLKTVEEYKSKKAVNRLYYSYGMLELIEAIFIGQKSAQVFSKIIEFLTKESPKFTDFLFNKKNDVLLSGPMLDKFFPRYAALDYAKAGTQCQSSTILVGNLNTCQSW
ncbi:hypothetical protein GPJ56_001233 [Histomonas meleagridis]|uniref:uncharacterized protein n=1 Tax=Histomonas meleagridis TaxID=135588 RepID=UPI003559A3FF|nr:hypothetical protein GPJ56_001233 [Histomonas meleagridis]KAH0797637.1 hypothetical protein GO595_009266 [Histomonas meleagridis]